MARVPTVIKIIERGPRGIGIPANGQPGQLVGYDANGNPIALNPTAASIPAGQPGQVLGYGAGGTPMAIDMTIPLSSSNW